MNRRFYLGSLLAIPAVVVMLAAIPGCPGGNKEGGKKEGTAPVATTDGGKGGGDKGGKPAAKGVAFVVTKADGTIKGRVIYDGTPPVMPEIKQMEGSGDKVQCHSGPEFTHKEQTWIVGKDHGVADVIVSLEPPDGKFFALDQAEADKYKKLENATIDQPYCVFEPHVTAVFAAFKDKDGKLHETHATLTVENSGKISHNTKSPPSRTNSGFNIAANPGKTEVIKDVKYQKAPLDIACDKHNWMSAKLLTFDHPFFARTDKDGNFEIKNVPAGVELTIKTWHQDATEATDKVNVKAGDTATKELKIKAKTAS